MVVETTAERHPHTTTIAKASGDAQQGTVGQPLLDPLIVVVTEDGAPSTGATVAWSTTAAGRGGEPYFCRDRRKRECQHRLGRLAPSQVPRQPRPAWPAPAGSPVTFTATGVADAAAAIAKAGGDGQTGEISSQLALPVQARVTDQFANGVQGVAVAWAATGGTVSSPSVPSNATGLSSVNVTAGGAAGPIVITAAADGLTGSPLTFNATAVVTPPSPAAIAITVGNDFFRSDRNQTTGPAVDTVAVGGTVTWTWVAGGHIAQRHLESAPRVHQ